MIIVVALAMVAVIGIAALVVETANWFEHQRHLQLQADAGALAGAQALNECISNAGAANTAIVGYAHQYAGDPSPPVGYTPARNSQVSNNSNVIIRVNSDNYGSSGSDNSITDPPGGAPCHAQYVDVKATENSLGFLSFLSGLVPSINTHARVSLQTLSSLSGSLPLAVEDVNPLQAGAIFVNEGSTPANAILGRQALTPGAAQTLNGQTVYPWTGGPTTITIPSSGGAPQTHTGVVIALCTNKTLCGTTPPTTTWLTGPASLSAICSQVFVTCYAGSGASPGLLHIQGYTKAGSGNANAPVLRSVTLTKGNCFDDSSPYFLLNAGCYEGVEADLDFGVTTDPSKAVSKGGLGAVVTVSGCNLNWVSTPPAGEPTLLTTSHWSISSCVNIPSGAGQYPLDVQWQTGSGSTKATGTFASAARPFANDGSTDTQSYPIAYAQLNQGANCTGGQANSLEFGSRQVCVGIGVLGNLQNARDVSDPTKVLKFIGGSHSGAINCGHTTLRDDIVYGCITPVQLSQGEACPNATTPVDCLPLRTGAKVGQARQGMNDRFAPSGCPPNNWTAPAGQLPNIPQGDPRVVPLIITLYGAFAGSGGGYVPVMEYATFYITGWDGDPPACVGINQPAPPGAGNGTIWGHFIKYVGDLGSSTGTPGCNLDPSSLTPCIIVMNK